MTICCSFVPANWPKMACVMEDGGWIVKEYMNIDEVVAMMVVCWTKMAFDNSDTRQ